MSIRIDNKFGTGTWDEILKTREKLLEERAEKKKTARKAAKKKKIEEKEFWDKVVHYFVEFFKLVFVLASAYGIGWIIWVNRCTEGNC